MADIESRLYLGDIAIPLRASLGYTEQWNEVFPPSFRQTWNGRAIVLKPSYKRKYSIIISASGAGVWRIPAFDNVEAGTELVLHSAREMTAVIPAGTKQCVLSRPHVPGSVRVIKPVSAEEEIRIAHTEAAGRKINVSANAPVAYSVLWRPATTVLFGSVSFDTDSLTGLGSWSLELMEKDAPL